MGGNSSGSAFSLQSESKNCLASAIMAAFKLEPGEKCNLGCMSIMRGQLAASLKRLFLSPEVSWLESPLCCKEWPAGRQSVIYSWIFYHQSLWHSLASICNADQVWHLKKSLFCKVYTINFIHSSCTFPNSYSSCTLNKSKP